MKQYKRFGDTGESTSVSYENYQPPVPKEIPSYTPTESLPLYDVPQHIQQKEYQREEANGINVKRAIRNLHIPTPNKTNQPSLDTMYQYQAVQQMPPQQMHPSQQQMYMYPPQSYTINPMMYSYPPPPPPPPVYPEDASVNKKHIKKNTKYIDDDDDLCLQIAKHLKKCKECKKKYNRNDSNTYLIIIVGLVLFILFLLTKIAG